MGEFSDSPIGKRLHEGKLNLPRAAILPESEKVCPDVFVGDEALQLRPDFMRPLPGARTEAEQVIFNYRLSRARRCVENAFGILVSRWRIYKRQINLQRENVDNVVKATCILHNFLSMTTSAAATYCPPVTTCSGLSATALGDKRRQVLLCLACREQRPANPQMLQIQCGKCL
ncbi:hypothetical protein HPB49_011258 [Dermacentor silvarum]|uniref:Uncharacterized protein n=1 Tax=Dermacentor silvarum TaxID=543639 RepID=A0ACB8C373_DERSI|nr:hypothetical protein HPB49_011258 [Dermacentor silvarum]